MLKEELKKGEYYVLYNGRIAQLTKHIYWYGLWEINSDPKNYWRYHEFYRPATAAEILEHKLTGEI